METSQQIVILCEGARTKTVILCALVKKAEDPCGGTVRAGSNRPLDLRLRGDDNGVVAIAGVG